MYKLISLVEQEHVTGDFLLNSYSVVSMVTVLKRNVTLIKHNIAILYIVDVQ